MEKTISMSTLAKHTERIAKDIETAGTVYRIKRPGNRSMLLVDDQYLERWRATVEFIAQHPNWEQELAQARQEYLAGRFVSLEHVIEELGLEACPSKAKRRKAARGNANRRRTKGH